jgi:hypothetical protein
MLIALAFHWMAIRLDQIMTERGEEAMWWVCRLGEGGAECSQTREAGHFLTSLSMTRCKCSHS